MPTFETAARFVIRGVIAVFTAVVMLFFQSAFWTNAVSVQMRAVLVGIAVMAYFRPGHALVLLAAMIPLAGAITSEISPGIRGAEAMVLAFLTGSLIRGWTLHRFRALPSNRVHVAVLVFGLIVAASAAEQLWLIQIQRDYPGPFLADLFVYVNRHYLSSFRGLGTIFNAMLFLEGLALLGYTAHYSRSTPDFPAKAIRMLIAGALGATLLNFAFFAHELIETGEPRARFMEFMTTHRWSAHVGDVNAAGSFFAMAMFIALLAAFADRSRAWYTLPAAIAIGLALWMTGSRTAVVAVALVGLICVAVPALRWRRPSRRVMAAGALVTVVLVLVTMRAFSAVLANPEAVDAVRIRGVFLRTTARMLASQPLFGIGVGQYSFWSRQFLPAGFQDAYYARENAHNNFAQVAGELGISGLAAFVYLLVTCLWGQNDARESTRPAVLLPVVVGVGAFIVTWLGGHPLLVAEVAYPFWIALGVAAAFVAAHRQAPTAMASIAAATLAMLLSVSLPARVDGKLPLIDLTRVTYGISGARAMTGRARFFVAGDSSRVLLPLRSRTAAHDEPIEIDISIDRQHAATVRFSNDKWIETPLELMPRAREAVRQIDLLLRESHAGADAVTGGRSRHTVDVGEWTIISKPNG